MRTLIEKAEFQLHGSDVHEGFVYPSQQAASNLNSIAAT